jgi:hypothetical protein
MTALISAMKFGGDLRLAQSLSVKVAQLLLWYVVEGFGPGRGRNSRVARARFTPGMRYVVVVGSHNHRNQKIR